MGLVSGDTKKEIPDFRTYHYQSPTIFRLFSFLRINLLTSIFSGICFFSLLCNGSGNILEDNVAWVCIVFILNIPILCETLVFCFELGFFLKKNNKLSF